MTHSELFSEVEGGSVVRQNVPAKTARRNIVNFPPAPTDDDFRAHGFWPQVGAAPSYDPLTQTRAGPRYEPDAAAQVVRLVWTVTDKALNACKAERKEAINAERDERLYPGRVTATLADGTMIPVDLRHEADGRNLQTVMAEALALQADGVTTAVMPFRDANDTAHTLTPADQITVCRAASAHGTAVYQASWAIKSQIDAAATVEDVAAVDLTAGWP